MTVSFAGQEKAAVADASGKWAVKLDPLAASTDGKPLTAAGSSTVTVADVIVGEVWILSGQSNMLFARSVAAVDAHLDLPKADDPGIRYAAIRVAPESEPQADVAGGLSWVVSTKETARNFSAVGYHFARKVRDELGVPVGLICTAENGVRLQAFMPPHRARSSVPGGKADVDKFQKQIDTFDPVKARAEYDKTTAKYQQDLAAFEALPAAEQKPNLSRKSLPSLSSR